MVLPEVTFQRYIEKFNRNDEEIVTQHISNKSALSWLSQMVPVFECPDKEIEETYYFRWWTYRKHIKSTSDGFIITEFLPPVPWAGKHNSIVCAAPHHLREGRWLRERRYLESYARFWFQKGGSVRAYSNWLVESIWQFCLVEGSIDLAIELLPDFVADYRDWESTNLHSSGLFWSMDDRDGGEYSISGNGLRPTLNSYMCANAITIAEIAEKAGDFSIADEFAAKADGLKARILNALWDPHARFFKVIPLISRNDGAPHSFEEVVPERNVRELHGFVPWYFNIPDQGYEAAWTQLVDEDAFKAPFGPTTAERRHPRFMEKHDHECLWNGPSWPYATSQTLVALANLLNAYNQDIMRTQDYIKLLGSYARSHARLREDGARVNWIDENLDPFSNDWLSRTILKDAGWPAHKGGYERGKDYNHSTFCDLIITGLGGLHPRRDNILELRPLLDSDWKYFCLDRVLYHGKELSVLYDSDGSRYKLGAGFSVFVDGQRMHSSQEVQRVTISLR